MDLDTVMERLQEIRENQVETQTLLKEMKEDQLEHRKEMKEAKEEIDDLKRDVNKAKGAIAVVGLLATVAALLRYF